MKHSDYLKKKKNRETRKKIISVISAIVVFITTYALVLPAITLDVSRASREPGIAFEQMQFKATASAASVTAADSTVEEVQVEEPAAEEAAEEEIIKEEAAEIPEEETSAVSDENEKEEAEQVVEEAPAESAREEAPAAEAEEVQKEEDKSAEEKADAEPSSEPAQEEAQTAETQKSADQAAVDQSDKSGTQATEAAAAASTEETAAEFQIPTLDPIDFDEILTGKTDFYFYHVEKTEEDENITSDSVDDWKKVSSDTVLAPEDFVRVYLSYEIPAGSLNETNAEARYRLPAGLELSDKQIKDINKYENGIAASKSGREHDKYLGAEAIEGSRTPNEKAGDEYISATVKAEKVYKDGEYVGQDLIFTFIPYTVEKNQISYDEAGKLTSEGRNVKGFFTFDLTTAQIDFEKTEKETVEKEDGTKEEIQYSRAEVVFVKENNKKNIDEISRILTMAGPSEKEEPQVQEPKTLISKGEDNDYTVTVSYTDDAQIPDNAELAVREIEKDTDEYASYLEQAKGAVDENKSVNEARFFDITIVADGEKIEPQAPVNVQITFTGIEQTNTDDTQLLHYKDDKEVEVMDQAEFSKSEEPENETKAVDTVQFETDGFSVYGIVGTEIITDPGEYIFEGDGFTVKINVPEEANIPSGTELVVTEVDSGTDDYIQLAGQTWAEINKEYLEYERITNNFTEDMGDYPEKVNPINISEARFFDISFIFDNEEVEPDVPVTVEIIYDQGLQASDDMVANIAHFGKNGLEIIDDVDTVIEDGEVISFKYEQDSFSETGTIVGNETVESERIETKAYAPMVRAVGDGENLSAPAAEKKLDYNEDGTYTLSLSVTGASQSSTSASVTKSNVVIVMDRSNSMNSTVYEYTLASAPYSNTQYYGYYDNAYVSLYRNGTTFYRQSGNRWVTYTGNVYTRESVGTRLTEEQDALNGMIASMVAQNKPGQTITDSDGNEISLADILEVKVISFATGRGDGTHNSGNNWSGGTESGWETTYGEGTNLYNVVYNSSRSTGTNWEEAMEYAKEVADAKKAAEPDEDVYVIFLTDGEPTTHNGSYDVNTDYADELQEAEPDAKAIVDAGYKFYGIFTYGSGTSADYLRRLVNYAYGNGDNTTSSTALTNYFFDATDTQALLDALQAIMSAITNALSYGNVSITDGMTTDASTSTIVSGSASGFKYTVSGDLGTLYTVTATGSDTNPTVTFTMANGESQTAQKGTYTYTVDGTEYTKTYYYVTIGEDEIESKMALATIDDDGKVSWDLGAIGTLMSGYTYTVSFVVWPDQDAYDYVAALNNGLTTMTNSEGETVAVTWNEELAEDTGKGYSKGGVAAYPSIVKYDNGTYGVLTNTDQTLKYSIVNEEKDEITGETTVTYGNTQTIELTPPTPMGLVGSTLPLVKKWQDNLQPSHANWPKIVLDLKMDDEVYISDIELTNTGEWTQSDFAIAPGLMVSSDKEAYQYATIKGLVYDGETYGILDKGHDYVFTEQEDSYDTTHYELTAYTYHPMLINGVLWNVTFSYDASGNINGVTLIDRMSDIGATNTLKGGINITKKVVDSDGNQVDYDGLFEASVTLNAPKDENGNPDLSHLDTYEVDGEIVDTSVAWYRYVNSSGSYVYDADLIAAGILEDSGRTDQYGPIGQLPSSQSNSGVTYDGSGYFMIDFDNTTGIAQGTIVLSTEYDIRFVNMASGIQYSLVETQKNGMTDSYSFTHRVYDDETESWVTTTDGDTHYTIGDAESNIDVTNTSDVIADILVTKSLQNYEWNGDSYYVMLSSEAVLPKTTKAALTAESGTDDVTYDFGNIHFATAGTYTYTFTEYDNTYETVYSGKVVNGVTYGNAVTVTVTVAENSDGNLEITEVEGGTLDGSTIKATVTNKVIPISLYKIGNSTPSTSLSGVKFKLYSDADCADTHLVTQDARGTAIGTSGEITTGSDGTVKIGILNAGTYYLQETATQDGYNKLSELVTITVAEDGTISYSQESHSPSKQYNSNSNAANLVKENGGLFITGTDDDGNATGYTITVNNTTGVELPNTGGPGTLLYTLSGIALMLGAALMYGFRMRRRERRLN